VDFNSGNYANDPYVYTPMTRDANGRIVTYFGAPVTTSSGVNPDRASTPLIAGSQNDADHQSELQSIVYRLEGIPNTSETITFDTIQLLNLPHIGLKIVQEMFNHHRTL